MKYRPAKGDRVGLRRYAVAPIRSFLANSIRIYVYIYTMCAYICVYFIRQQRPARWILSPLSPLHPAQARSANIYRYIHVYISTRMYMCIYYVYVTSIRVRNKYATSHLVFKPRMVFVAVTRPASFQKSLIWFLVNKLARLVFGYKIGLVLEIGICLVSHLVSSYQMGFMKGE